MIISVPFSNFSVERPIKLNVNASSLGEYIKWLTCLKAICISNFFSASSSVITLSVGFSSPNLQFKTPFDLVLSKVNNSFNPSLNTCCSIIIGLPENPLSTSQFTSIGPGADLAIVHFAKFDSGWANGIWNSISDSISLFILPIITNLPSSEHLSPFIDSGFNIVGSFALFSSTEKSIIAPLLIASAVLTGSSKVLFSGIPAISSESLISKDLYSFVLSKSLIVHLKSAWAWPPAGSTSWSSVHIASDNVWSSSPFPRIKYKNMTISVPFSNFWVETPKKLNEMIASLWENVKWLTCLKDKFIFNIFSASSSVITLLVGFSLPTLQFKTPFDLVLSKVNNSFNPSLNTCCSIIIGLPENPLSTSQFTSIGPGADLAIVHFAKFDSGWANGIWNSISDSISLFILPIITNLPSSEHLSPFIDSGFNIVGSFALFSSTEKSIIAPLLIASAVLTGSSKVLFSGIPAISSESLISKDLYSFVLSKSLIVHLKSAWAWPPAGSTSWSSVHIASDNVWSSSPFPRIKYKNMTISVPFSNFWVVKA